MWNVCDVCVICVCTSVCVGYVHVCDVCVMDVCDM